LYMTKATLKEVNQIIAYCEQNQICIKDTFSKMSEGTKEWCSEGLKLIDVAPKLTKPEREAKAIADAASSAVQSIMANEKSRGFSADFIKREACKMFTELYIEKPKLFKQAVQVAIDEYDKSIGIDFSRQSSKPTIKESQLNPAFKDWAEKQGLEVEPLPEQRI
jgi:hypothetical protein